MRKTRVEFLEAAVTIQAAHFERQMWRLRGFEKQRAKLRAHVATQRATRAALAEAMA